MHARPNTSPWTPLGMPDVVLMVSPAQSYNGNIHDELKLVWSAGGYQIERRGQLYRAGPEQLIALHPGEAHSGRPAGLDSEDGRRRAESEEWRIICVPWSLVGRVADPSNLRFEPPVIDDADLSKKFWAVFELFEQPASQPEREEGLLELVAALVPHASPDAPPPVAPSDELALRRARDYLAERLSSNITLDELADVARVDKFRLVRVCTARLGLAPHTLHLRLRLDRARQLIRRGDQLTDIGQATGFYDQAHFSRTFARAFGLTPRQYRAGWTSTGPHRKFTGD